MAGAGALDDFADEVADIVEASRGADLAGGSGGGRSSTLADLFARQKVGCGTEGDQRQDEGLQPAAEHLGASIQGHVCCVVLDLLAR